MPPPGGRFLQGHAARPRLSDRKEARSPPDDGAGRRREGVHVLPGANHDRCEGAATPLVGGAQQQEDRTRDCGRPRHRSALRRRRQRVRAGARSRVYRRGGARDRAARSRTSGPRRECGVECHRETQEADRGVAQQEASAQANQGPDAAGARAQRGGELRHAAPVRDPGAGLATEGADHPTRGSPGGPGGPARLPCWHGRWR